MDGYLTTGDYDIYLITLNVQSHHVQNIMHVAYVYTLSTQWLSHPNPSLGLTQLL
jgi:hypothetical protein